MQIDNHKLNPGWYKQSPNIGGALNNPTLLVMHFTASGGTGPVGDADYFLKPAAKASAHIVLGRDGDIRQVVPFNRKAWHAGKSIWRGKPNCNDFSIGIEIDNWGKLTRAQDGQTKSWTGEIVDSSRAVQLTHKNETAPSLWEIYNETQLLALVDLTKAILDAYPSIQEIVGHDDIAPHRKTDPGPAFPMSRFESLVDGRANVAATTRDVWVQTLNARGGPGLEFDVQGEFTKGTKVKVLYDAPGAWAQVEGKLATGKTATAWVWDAYLR